MNGTKCRLSEANKRKKIIMENSDSTNFKWQATLCEQQKFDGMDK